VIPFPVNFIGPIAQAVTKNSTFEQLGRIAGVPGCIPASAARITQTA
jgi:hypothetical protein